MDQASDRAPERAYDPPHGTALGQRLAAPAGVPADRSGFVLLDSGEDAWAARLALVRTAQQSIDAQYYIWNEDETGRLLAAEMLGAAERGVRIRVLLDDFNVGAKASALAALDSHPQISVRLYNPAAPTARRGVPWALGLVADHERLNRRMHNKSLTVDGAATVLGGRNIGDEYFDRHPTFVFRDLEVLGVGSVAAEVADAFDLYWNSAWAYPVGAALRSAPSADELRQVFDGLRSLATARDQKSDAELAALATAIHWAPHRLVYDQPLSSEVTSAPETPQAVAVALAARSAQARREILIESAYLVIGEEGRQLIGSLTAGGVQMNALTNSLASNDVLPNHAAYARVRKNMLLSGLQIHELRPDAAACGELIANDGCRAGRLLSVHSKAAVIDRETLFVGSFNLNQRSIYLNTEIGLLIDSPVLAGQVAEGIIALLRPENSWSLELDRQGRLRWLAADGVVVSHDPQTSAWRRAKVWLLSLLPAVEYF